MAIPNSNLDSMLRLSGLKSAAGRRVKNDPGFLKDMGQEELDMEGTAPPPAKMPEFSNFLPTPERNEPEPDLGGELTSQSYDVRANEVNVPEEKNVYSRLGRSLKNPNNMSTSEILGKHVEGLSQDWSNWWNGKPPSPKGLPESPPIETAQTDIQEGISPSTDSHLNYQPQPIQAPDFSGFSNALKQYIEPFKTRGHYYGEMTPERETMLEDAQLQAKGIDPVKHREEQAQIKSNTQESVMKRMDKALENPTTTAVYGASDIVANQPALQKEFKTITGMDFTNQIAQQTQEYEKVLQDMQDNYNNEGNGYNEQEKRIQERILSNQATDQDKYYIGLAVLLPLIAGAFFGKEAALGALSGTAEGFAKMMGNRQKDTMENEKLLANIGVNKGDLALKQSELDLKRLEMPSKIQKNLPDDPNEHLIGKKEIPWVDSEGQPTTAVRIKPGLVVPREYVKDKEELKEMRKQADEISSAINPTKEINKLTGDIINIAGKLEDKNIVGQALGAYLSGKDPGLATQIGEQIEYEGRMVNSYVVLEHKLKLLVDAYRQAKGMRALTSSVQEHIDGLFRNPSASFQSPQDTIDQMIYTRDLAQNRLLNSVKSSGFIPEFVIEELQPEVKAVYNALNTREGEKESSELLRE
jgi:hypothetical protein